MTCYNKDKIIKYLWNEEFYCLIDYHQALLSRTNIMWMSIHDHDKINYMNTMFYKAEQKKDLDNMRKFYHELLFFCYKRLLYETIDSHKIL